MGGAKPIDVELCRQTWIITMPDFELVEINENESQYFNLQVELRKSPWLRDAYNRKKWAFVADYVRVYLLYTFGGIYLDSDMSAVRSLEPLLNNAFFAGYYHGEIAGGIIGSEKNNMFLHDMLVFYRNKAQENDFFTINTLLSNTIPIDSYKFDESSNIFNDRNGNKISIYKDSYFYPVRLGEPFSDSKVLPTTYTIHWWKGSWYKNS